MKIFEIIWWDEERSWIAANTNIEAIQIYCSTTGMDLNDFGSEDSIIELHEKKWDKCYISDEDGLPKKTFKQWMEENKTPDILAESHY